MRLSEEACAVFTFSRRLCTCNFAERWNSTSTSLAIHTALRNRNHKLENSRVPTKAKSREPAYSPAFNQNKVDTQLVKLQRQAGWQTIRLLYSECCLELR